LNSVGGRRDEEAIMAKCWLRLLAVALVGAGASLASSRADESATFPLSERAFLLGLGPHPAHKKGETPPDLQKALAEALVLAVFRYTEMYAKNGFFLIDRFDKKRIDVFGFTSYPRFASPSDIPADYYRPITERTGSVPIAFTEIG